VALFPALSMQWGDARMTGILFSSMAIGSLIATVLSGWSARIQRQGRVVVIAAASWGLFILGAGLSRTPWLIVLFLILAGGADMVSGLFRGIIWNYAVPNSMRGRLAGIAMISYMSGPLLGNTRAGWVASLSTVSFSLWSGGIACVIAVVATSLALPRFWAYRAEPTAPARTADSPVQSTLRP
jgi:MFS family permease